MIHLYMVSKKIIFKPNNYIENYEKNILNYIIIDNVEEDYLFITN